MSARGSRPAGVELVHPEWRAAALGDDPRLRAILDGEIAVAPEVEVWVDRLVLGGFVDMPGDDAEGLAALPRARPDWLVIRIERIGLRQLAHAIAGAPKEQLAALAARLGVRGKAFVETVRWVGELGDAATARLGPRRAAQARCDGVRIADDRLALIAIGARAAAPHVAAGGGALARQLAQRLPILVGQRVLAELETWREAPIGETIAIEEIVA